MTSAVEFFDDRPDKSAHTTAGIVTVSVALLLFLLLWLWKIVIPIPPFPDDPQVLTVTLYNGPKPGGTNQVLGGGSQGNTGDPGAQNDAPTEANSNPSQTGAITNPNSSSDVHSNASSTPNAQPSVSSETQALLDKLKNKKNNTSVTVGGQGNSGPYSTGVGDGNGPGVGPGDGGIPGGGNGGGGGDKTIRIIYSPDVANPTQEEGVVAVRVYVDREGNVTKAEATTGGTTTGNPQLKATATQSAYKVRFNADDKRGDIVQCIISFKFTLQK
jgi:protein TonB